MATIDNHIAYKDLNTLKTSPLHGEPKGDLIEQEKVTTSAAIYLAPQDFGGHAAQAMPALKEMGKALVNHPHHRPDLGGSAAGMMPLMDAIGKWILQLFN